MKGNSVESVMTDEPIYDSDGTGFTVKVAGSRS